MNFANSKEYYEQCLRALGSLRLCRVILVNREEAMRGIHLTSSKLGHSIFYPHPSPSFSPSEGKLWYRACLKCFFQTSRQNFEPNGWKLLRCRQQKANFGMAGNFPFLASLDHFTFPDEHLHGLRRTIGTVVSIFIGDIFLLSLPFQASFVTTKVPLPIVSAMISFKTSALLGLFTVLAFQVLVNGSITSDTVLRSARLVFKEHSSENLQGCYSENEKPTLCFDIQATFIELSNGDNRTLVRFSDLPHEMFLFQILDDAFVGYRSSKVPMHFQDLTRKHSSPPHNRNWKKMYDTEHNPNITTRDAFSAKLQSALSRLHNTREISMLHALSTALKENASTHVIQMRFHVLCMTLIPGNSHKDTAASRIVGYNKEKENDGSMKLKHVRGISSRKKRNIFRSKRNDICLDLRSDPHGDECLGMCGPGCACWSFVCGNCCYNKLCLEHDRCCRHDISSLRCMLPFLYQLSCKDGFGGYPGCLN